MDLIWDDDDVDDIIMLIMQDSDTDDSSDDSSDDEEDSDDEEADPPPHIWGSGSRVGKAPNVNVVVCFILTYSSMTSGVLCLFTTPLTSSDSSSYQLGYLTILWQRLSQRTGTSFRKRMRSGDWDCRNYRRSVPPSDS